MLFERGLCTQLHGALRDCNIVVYSTVTHLNCTDGAVFVSKTLLQCGVFHACNIAVCGLNTFAV